MPHPVRSVAVFCGSRAGADPAHAEAAAALGQALGRAGITLVYGGGGIGLMGVVAEATLAAGGAVRGVIPEFLTRLERPTPQLAALEVVPSMHARKTRMFELADAFICLSGGLGTIDETVEILTWRQLRLHDKAVIVMDIAGWAHGFVRMVESLVAQGFAEPGVLALFSVAADVPAAMALLQAAPAGGFATTTDRL